MLLQLLGTPRLLQGGQAVRVGSRKALAMLAVIALDGGVTRERLSGLLWPEFDLASARRNLRRELFRLRELGVALAEAADGTLAIDPALVVDALQLLRDDGLPTVGGPAFEGLDGVGSPELDLWLLRWREQLARRRLHLLTRAASDSEQRGDLAAALALHGQRWAADRCDESAALQVIRLRAALGDPVGALHDYQRYVDALRHELDLAPSESASTLALQLRGQRGPVAAAEAPAVVVAAVADTVAVTKALIGLPALVPFVRREAVQRRIDAAWSRGQRVYLHGPAGTGKTRLSCEMAVSRGPWLRVACEPQDGELPYSSVIRLLRALRESAPDVTLPGWVRRELSQLLPDLGEPPQALATAEARQRLLAAAAEAWRLLMHNNFSAFVLDDWQWGDAASVELWSCLEDAAVAAAGSVVWIISYRSAQLPAAALKRQRADIDNGHGVAVALEGMDVAEVLALTHALSGSSGGKLFSQRLHEATEGNPFFLLETLRHLFEQGLLSADARGWSTPFDEHTERYAELPVPASVRAAVQARARALSPTVQRLLEVASLCSGELDAHVLAGVAGVDEEAVVGALEHACTAQLVHETEAGWCFAHDLVRQSLVHGLSPARRRLLHERLALKLEEGGVFPALVAAQWEAAERPASAVRWRLAAAEAALRVHAFNEALANYAQALADGASGGVAEAIHLACADVHGRRTDRAAADAAFAAAASAAAGDPLAGPAEVLRVQLARAEHLSVTDRIDECFAALDALEPELSAAPLGVRAKALAVRGAGMMRRGQFNDAASLLTAAESLFEGLPSARRELAALLLNLTRCSNWRGDTEAWERYARRAVAVHESLDDPAGLANALSWLSLFHRAMGQGETAIVVGERARDLAARSGNVPVHRNVNFHLLQAHMGAGDTDRVLQLLDEGEALAPGFETINVEQNYLAARFYVHFLRGEVAAARDAGDRLLAMSKGKGRSVQRVGYLLLVIDLYIDIGDWRLVRTLIDEAQAAADVHIAGGDSVWFATDMAFKQATLALADGRPADALALLPTTGPDEIDDRVHHAWIGAAAARALGDTEGAMRRLDAVGADEAAAAHPLVLWLEQRLAVAAEAARADATAVARAEALLAARRVPALLVERLRRALDAAPR